MQQSVFNGGWILTVITKIFVIRQNIFSRLFCWFVCGLRFSIFSKNKYKIFKLFFVLSKLEERIMSISPLSNAGPEECLVVIYRVSQITKHLLSFYSKHWAIRKRVNVRFCQKVPILLSYLQTDEHFNFLNLKI